MSKFKIEFDGCEGCLCGKPSPMGVIYHCLKTGKSFFVDTDEDYPDWCPLLSNCEDCRYWRNLNAEDITSNTTGVCLKNWVRGMKRVDVRIYSDSCPSFRKKSEREV